MSLGYRITSKDNTTTYYGARLVGHGTFASCALEGNPPSVLTISGVSQQPPDDSVWLSYHLAPDEVKRVLEPVYYRYS